MNQDTFTLFKNHGKSPLNRLLFRSYVLYYQQQKKNIPRIFDVKKWRLNLNFDVKPM